MVARFMDKLFFIRPLLSLLSQGRFFCRAVAIILRVSAGVLVLFSLTTFFQAGKVTFELPAHGIPGGALFEVFFVVAVYASVHVIILRARDIEQLPPSEFFALPMGALLVRLIGEAYASFVGLVAIGGGLFVWFTNQSLGKIFYPALRAMFPAMREDTSFLGGIEFMTVGVLTALAVLVVSYILSDVLGFLGRLAGRQGPAVAPRPIADNPFRSRFGS
jgi:hypothetical protein